MLNNTVKTLYAIYDNLPQNMGHLKEIIKIIVISIKANAEISLVLIIFFFSSIRYQLFFFLLESYTLKLQNFPDIFMYVQKQTMCLH